MFPVAEVKKGTTELAQTEKEGTIKISMELSIINNNKYNRKRWTQQKMGSLEKLANLWEYEGRKKNSIRNGKEPQLQIEQRFTRN